MNYVKFFKKLILKMYKNCSKVLFQSYPDTPDAEEKKHL